MGAAGLFQQAAKATSRNRRLLVSSDFELHGVSKTEWPDVIEDTFSFHNDGRTLADYDMLRPALEDLCKTQNTIGDAIEAVGRSISRPDLKLQDLSEYQVIMLWPVVDAKGIERVSSFANRLDGYKLSWSAWFHSLNDSDRKSLPLTAYNRARLYFDLRIVPIQVADLHDICKQLNEPQYSPSQSALRQFRASHYYTVVSGDTQSRHFKTLHERTSKRSTDAKAWYEDITGSPTIVGRRIAQCLAELGLESVHEHAVISEHSRVVADVFSTRPNVHQRRAITELKLFSSRNTTHSRIRDEIRSTLRKYAHLAGYIPRQ